MQVLPDAFREKMKDLLGAEYEAFLASYDQPRRWGLRVNTEKISPQEFEALAPFSLTRIPWVENGYYYKEADAPARHPFYYAGLYYLQEPSAMTPAAMLQVSPGERVLDLCAAPGGKATELGARLRGQGLLVANDLSASRAKALLKNLEVFGIANAFVTNEPPAKLAEKFPAFFDRILVDAPCSGEGMFRKDPAVARAWTAEKPLNCAKQQKEIINWAAQMLAPGGQLLYSTCTFSPEENEQVIAWLLKTRADMELLPLPCYEGFSRGIPWTAGLAACDLEKCVRIFPHKAAGEGHFLALLQKRGAKQDFSRQEKTAGTGALRGGRTFAPPGKAQNAEWGVLRDFLKEIRLPLAEERLEIRRGQAYYVPPFLENRTGMRFLRNGLYLGEIKKERFEPSQSLAMALTKEQYTQTIDLDYRDERVLRYLKGETIEIEAAAGRKGWQLVCVNGYPLGWGKLTNGALKNKYHAGWRMKS